MKTAFEFDSDKWPKDAGWYPVLVCWDVEEGFFPDACHWDGVKWTWEDKDSRGDVPVAAVIGTPFSSAAGARKVADENDPLL